MCYEQTVLWEKVPTRPLSRLWGTMARLHVPVGLRSTIYGAYAWAFGADLDLTMGPLDAYPTLADFFARPLKPGARILQSAPLVCCEPRSGCGSHGGSAWLYRCPQWTGG